MRATRMGWRLAELGWMLGLIRAALLLAACLAPMLAHAAVFRITLADGTEFVGSISAFEDGIYTIATSTGERQLPVAQLAELEPMALARASPPYRKGSPATTLAPEFVFTAANSRMVVGQLLAFEDGVYEVLTRSGTVNLPSSQVQRVDLSWIERPKAATPSGKTLTGGSVRIAGADAIAQLYIPAILEAYSGTRGGRDPLWSRGTLAQLRTFTVTVPNQPRFLAEVRSSDSTSAARALAGGQTDIAIMSRRMLPEEAKAVADRGMGNALSPAQEFELASSGAVILVHPSNPVKALRAEQVADIFSGRIRNWSEVGGAARRIQVFTPADGSGALETLRRQVLNGAELIPTAKRLDTDAEMSETVSIDAAAIGLAEYSSVGNAAALSLIDTCGRPIAPTEFNIQTREYPLSTTLYLYTTNKPTPAARAFLDFATSTAAQDALRQSGLPNALPFAQADEAGLSMPAAARWPASSHNVTAHIERFVASAKRLSVAIRFAGADRLQVGPDGERDFNRLVEYMRGQDSPPRLVLLAFSDIEGDLAASVGLSARRASLVETRLKKLGLPVEAAFGLGPLRPVTCDAQPATRLHNRRVEAWLLQ
jgi:phosphate transport system substrate-binding protein